MVEKRFKYKESEKEDICGIYDDKFVIGFAYKYRGNVKAICNLLNNLNDQIIAQGVIIEGYQDRNQKLFEETGQLKKENGQLKQERELLKKGLKEYEDTLPLFLTCADISAFHSELYDFKIEKMKFYNENQNLRKIRIDERLIE